MASTEPLAQGHSPLPTHAPSRLTEKFSGFPRCCHIKGFTDIAPSTVPVVFPGAGPSRFLRRPMLYPNELRAQKLKTPYDNARPSPAVYAIGGPCKT